MSVDDSETDLNLSRRRLLAAAGLGGMMVAGTLSDAGPAEAAMAPDTAKKPTPR